MLSLRYDYTSKKAPLAADSLKLFSVQSWLHLFITILVELVSIKCYLLTENNYGFLKINFYYSGE